MDLLAQAPVIAAIVAAVAALIAAWNTRSVAKLQLDLQKLLAHEQLSAQTQQASQKLEFDKQVHASQSMALEIEAVRKTLKDLAELSTRVATSVRRLLELSRTLDDSKMMIETAQTFSVVSEFFTKTDSNTIVSVPPDVASALDELRRTLTTFFLELDYAADKRRSPDALARLTPHYNEMMHDVSDLHRLVRSYVAPRLEKVHP